MSIVALDDPALRDDRATMEGILARVDEKTGAILRMMFTSMLDAGARQDARIAAQKQEAQRLQLLLDAYQRDNIRLRNKCNQLLDHIDSHGAAQQNLPAAEAEEGGENGTAFLLCLARCFRCLEALEKVYTPQRQKGDKPLVYIPVSDCYAFFAERLPAYSKNTITNLLTLFGVADTSEKGCQTSYKGNRVFKVYAAVFHCLCNGLS